MNGWDEVVRAEREACARICDREALLLIARSVGCRFLREGHMSGVVGKPDDPVLLDAYSRGDTEAFIRRALEVDDEEARSVRATISAEGRMAAKIRMRSEPGSHPSDWRPSRGYFHVPDLGAKSSRPRKELL